MQLRSSQIEEKEKQEQIVPERSARLSLDPWKKWFDQFFTISDHFWKKIFLSTIFCALSVNTLYNPSTGSQVINNFWMKVKWGISLIMAKTNNYLRFNTNKQIINEIGKNETIQQTSWLMRLWSFWIFATSRSFSLLISLDFSFRTEFWDSKRSNFVFT